MVLRLASELAPGFARLGPAREANLFNLFWGLPVLLEREARVAPGLWLGLARQRAPDAPLAEQAVARRKGVRGN